MSRSFRSMVLVRLIVIFLLFSFAEIPASASCGGTNATTITFTTASGSSAFGQSVMFTATVTDTGGAFGSAPTGNVIFTADGVTPIGTGFLAPVGGVSTTTSTTSASISTLSLTAPNPHTITANYEGDPNFACSATGDGLNGDGPTITQTITMGASTTSVTRTSGTTPSVLGTSLTFTATVSDAGASGTAPTGTVLFQDNGVSVGGGTLTPISASQSTATFATSVLVVGSHSITGVYAGDTNFGGSNSNASPVAQAISARTTTTTVPTTGSVTVGTASTVTVMVSDQAAMPPDTTPGTSSIVTGATLNHARWNAAAALLQSGKVLIAGGLDGLTNQSVELYNPVSKTFSNSGCTLSVGRVYATATTLQNGKVLIAGGSTDGTFGNAQGSADIYDPSSDTCTASTGTMTALEGHTATLLSNGTVLIAGGETTSGPPALTATQIYTPGTDSFGGGTVSLLHPRVMFTATMLPSGLILYAGGDVAGDAELLNPATGSIATGSMVAARSLHTAVLMPDGLVVIAGGQVGGATAVNGIEIYDSIAGTFSAVLTNGTTSSGNVTGGTDGRYLTDQRTGATGTALNDGTVLIGGGKDNTPTILASAEAYIPSYDPQGTVSLVVAGDTGALPGHDTVAGCTLGVTGTGASMCEGSINPRHVYSGRTINANYAFADWAVGFAYSKNDLILPLNNVSSTNAGGYIFEATNATTSVTEPTTWPQNILVGSNTVSDGGVTWMNVGLPNHSGSSTTAAETLTVNPIVVTLTAVTDSKTYDGTTTSTQSPTASTPLLSGDTASQSFTSRNALGAGASTLTANSTILNGITNVSADYTVTIGATATGTINQLGITVTAVNNSKTYDRTTIAAATPTFTVLASGDTTTTFTETYNTAAAGTNNKTLTPSGLVNDGNGGANYSYTYTPFTTGTITQLGITETVTAASKTYDRTNTATISNCSPVGVIAGDAVTCSAGAATFPSKAAGNNLTVTATGITLGGSDGANYSPTATETTTATISQLGITETVTAANKTYDQTNAATISNCSPVGVISGDTVTCTATSATFPSKAVGNNLTITATGIALGGADGGNYSPTATETTTANISQLGITETVTAANKTYDRTATATVNTCAPVGVIAGDMVTCTAGSASFPSKAAGNGLTVTATGITFGGTDGANYSPTATEATTANISQLGITETVTAANKTYDQTAAATINSCSAVGVIAGDTVTCTPGAASFPSKAAGNGLTVTATGITLGGADGGNYSPTATETTTATISQLGITETVTAANKTYDRTNAATINTCSPVGTFSGDTVTCTVGSATFPSKVVGNNLTVTASGITLGGGDGANYSPTSTETTTASISQLGITETVAAANKTYDGTTTATINTCTPVGTIAGDAVTCAAGGATFATRNVGNSLNVTASGITLGGGDGANYSPTATEATTANISQLALTVTAATNTKPYDGTPSASAIPTLSSIRGVGAAALGAGGDTANFSEVYDTRNANPGHILTPSGSVLDNNGGANYSYSFVTNSTGLISQLPLTVTAVTFTKVYDSTTAVPPASAVPSLSSTRGVGAAALGAGDSSPLIIEAFTSKDAGSGKALIPVTTGGFGVITDGNSGNNYSYTYVNDNTGIVTPFGITGTVTASNKTYDGGLTATITACSPNNIFAVDSGLVSCTAPTANFTDKNVGVNKMVNAAGLTLSGSMAGDYSLNSTTATTTASITARTLNVSATATNKVYDATVNASINLSDNRIAGDQLTFTSNASFTDKNVGNNKTVNITGIAFVPGGDASNYTLSSSTTTATANITQASLTVTASGSNKVYDGTNTATVTLSDNHITGDLVTDNPLPPGGATFPDKMVGVGRVVSVSGISISGADFGNYNLASTTATTSANITQRPITITAAADTKTYDGSTAAATAPTVTLGSLATGDTAVFTETYSTKTAGPSKMLNPAAVINDGNGGNNYLVTPTSANVGTINPLAIAGSITASNKVYDTTNTATISCAPAGVIPPDQVNCTATSATFSDKNVGNAKTVTASGVSLSGADAGNYSASMTSTTTASITPASLTVSAGGVSKVYDGTNTATVMLTDNHLGTDNVVDNFGSATFSDKNVGTVKQVSVGGISISGGDAANYTLTNVTAVTSANITPRTLVVSAAGVNKVFDATTTATVSLSDNRVTGDSLTDSFATAAFASPNVGTGIGVSVSGVAISGTDANNYSANASAATTAAITPATTTSVVTVPESSNAAEFTFAATVSPQIAGTPTGSVTFMDNGTPLGAGASGSSTVPLTNGAASFTLLVGQLGSGQHNITAVYSKDANFAAATTQVPAGVTVAATLSVSPGAPIAAQNITLSNPTGQSVTYTNLKCSVLSSLGAAVANTLCSVNPASVTVPANGTASIAVDLATNSAATATLRMNGLSTLWMAMPAVVFLPLAAPASIRKRLLRRKVITILGLTLLLAALMFSIGCGGGGFNNPTPLQPGSGTSTTTQPGSYVVQISGTGANGQVSLASIPMTVGF